MVRIAPLDYYLTPPVLVHMLMILVISMMEGESLSASEVKKAQIAIISVSS